MRIELIHGNATEYEGDADLLLTNPYAPLPLQLRGKPMLICGFTHAKAEMEGYCSGHLQEVSKWHDDFATIWAANMPVTAVDLSYLSAVPPGWFPEELVYRLLRVYGRPGITVWDGFMGRGTVGKVCRKMGMGFIGIDNKKHRVEMARDYINSN